MIARFRQWLSYKWRGRQNDVLAKAYHETFSTLSGQLVLQDLMDQVYATVCHAKDPIELATHNGRRSLLHEILLNIDMAEHPDKYNVQPTEGEVWPMNRA